MRSVISDFSPPNPFAYAADFLEGPKPPFDFTKYQHDPEGFFRDVLGLPVWPDEYPVENEAPYTWEHQVKILWAIRDQRRTAIRSCHASGKDWVVARAVCWFLCCFPQSKVITTGPGARQVEKILWPEIRTAASHARIDLPGTRLLTSWTINDGWYAIGFKSDDARSEQFQGYHARHVLILVDEASGVGDEVFKGIDGLMTGGDVRLVMISQPTQPSGAFFNAFNGAQTMYETIHIEPEDLPNFQPKVLKAWEHDRKPRLWSRWPAPYLLTPVDVQDYADNPMYGPESAEYAIHVRGDFPVAAPDTIIPLSWVKRAQGDRTPAWSALPVIELGIDVGGDGDDETVVIARQGPRFLRLDAWRHEPELMRTAVKVREIVTAINTQKNGRVMVMRIDAGGLGFGLPSILRSFQADGSLDPAIQIIDMGAGEQALDPEHYVNRRAEYWASFRQRLSEDAVYNLPKDPTLEAQLVAPKGKRDLRNRFQVERKEDMKKRLSSLGSPDRADALVLAYLTDQAKLPSEDGAVGRSEYMDVVDRIF